VLVTNYNGDAELKRNPSAWVAILVQPGWSQKYSVSISSRQALRATVSVAKSDTLMAH